MAFTFEIERVDRFPRQGIGVLDGRLLDGYVSEGSCVELVHHGEHFPLRVSGVALGSRLPQQNGKFSLSVDLRQDAMAVVRPGDVLMADKAHRVAKRHRTRRF